MVVNFSIVPIGKESSLRIQAAYIKNSQQKWNQLKAVYHSTILKGGLNLFYLAPLPNNTALTVFKNM